MSVCDILRGHDLKNHDECFGRRGLLRAGRTIACVLALGLMGGTYALGQHPPPGAGVEPTGSAAAMPSPEVSDVQAASADDAAAGSQVTASSSAAATAQAATPIAAGQAGKLLTPVATSKKGAKKEKQPKPTPMSVVQGTLTVDGWTGKARLNYDIADLKYLYVWAPGIGTVVVSNEKFPMAKEEANAFSDNTLTVSTEGHTIQLYSERRLLGKKPATAWVYVDRAYNVSAMYPVLGYGSVTRAPYAWPGAKKVQEAKGVIAPPPLPAGLRPALAQTGCVPAGPKAAGTPCAMSAAANTTAAGIVSGPQTR